MLYFFKIVRLLCFWTSEKQTEYRVQNRYCQHSDMKILVKLCNMHCFLKIFSTHGHWRGQIEYTVHLSVKTDDCNISKPLGPMFEHKVNVQLSLNYNMKWFSYFLIGLEISHWIHMLNGTNYVPDNAITKCSLVNSKYNPFWQ